jgi:hypothetical protein
MKKFAKWLFGIVLVLFIIYFIGPKPPKPEFETPLFNLPVSLTELEKQIYDSEKAIKGIKPDNEARIIWADSAKKEKTQIAFLYLHGFSASQADGDPVFMAYYYKNENDQDNTASVPAMLKMFDELGTPNALKQKMAFPETGAHVIASYIRSKDWQGVERETDKFLADIVKR